MIKKSVYIIVLMVILICIYKAVIQVECTYYSKGKVKTKQIENRLIGKLKVLNYYENGNIKEEVTYLKDNNDNINEEYFLHGTNLKYYETGELKVRSNYRNGKLDGYEEIYYKSGAIYSIINHRLNKIIGNGIVYYEDGLLKAFNRYKDNKPYYAILYPRSMKDWTSILIPWIEISGPGISQGDTISCKLSLIVDDTPFKLENFVINYDILEGRKGLEFLHFPRPRNKYYFKNGDEEIVNYIIEGNEDEVYIYGYLAEIISGKITHVHRDFFILLPKDSFSIFYPSNDTTYIKSIKM